MVNCFYSQMAGAMAQTMGLRFNHLATPAQTDMTLRQRLRAANKRCSSFPEQSRNPDGSVTVKADAWLALLELRNMSTEIDNALWKLEELEKRDEQFVSVKREGME
jgi:hypothetical protein